MSLIEMSQQHRTTPARATFAMDLNTNNETNSSTDRISSDLVGTGIAPNADHFTPTRRYSTITNCERRGAWTPPGVLAKGGGAKYIPPKMYTILFASPPVPSPLYFVSCLLSRPLHSAMPSPFYRPFSAHLKLEGLGSTAPPAAAIY